MQIRLTFVDFIHKEAANVNVYINFYIKGSKSVFNSFDRQSLLNCVENFLQRSAMTSRKHIVGKFPSRSHTRNASKFQRSSV